GTSAPDSIVQHEDKVFFLANDGFREIVQARYSRAIGEGVVDQFFFNLVDRDYINEVQGSSNVVRQNIIWIFASVNSPVAGLPDSALIYNHVYKRWGYIKENATLIAWLATSATTLEGLDAFYPETGQPTGGVDSIPGSLDDPVWAGGEFQLGVFDHQNRLGFLTGPPRVAEIDTPEYGGGPQKIVNRFVYPRAMGSSVLVQVGTRDNTGESITWGPSVALNGGERVGYRFKSRFARVRLIVSDGEDFYGADLEHEWGSRR
ncbi:MAG: hypothetical protein R3330_10340, partial [Saprospiraceae bacterium]|nr:hypothetical protein [Saprospiraceae bacterium]